jgi:hypothetical protein
VALEKALAAAREAGASPATADALAAEAAAARREAADTRPLGARLDSARARMKKAEARVTASAAALAQAQDRCAEARAQLESMRTELAMLETEVANAPAAERPYATQVQGDQKALLQCTKDLLERLETGGFAAKADMPPELLGAMTAVHEVMRTMEPELAPTLDGPLGPEAPAAAPGSRRPQVVDEVSANGEQDGGEGAESEDEIMADLDGAHEEDEASLLLIAQRLKRARRV